MNLSTSARFCEQTWAKFAAPISPKPSQFGIVNFGFRNGIELTVRFIRIVFDLANSHIFQLVTNQMNTSISKIALSLAFAFCISVLNSYANAQATAPAKETTQETEEKPEPVKVALKDGAIQFAATGTWKSVKPRSGMVKFEMQVPKVGDDANDGRLTFMPAGGSIEANITRWRGQFAQPDGSDTADKTKTEKMELAGQTVHMVDISGTYMDSPMGPRGKKVERANYRMLAAIIETADYGKIFVKLYGPKGTIDKNADHFKSMIKSLEMAE